MPRAPTPWTTRRDGRHRASPLERRKAASVDFHALGWVDPALRTDPDHAIAQRPAGTLAYRRGMALFHVATLTPTKDELIAHWLPKQPFGPAADDEVTVVGAFRFDDPLGQVGMETFVAEAAGVRYLVPLTYRGAPLDGAEDALVGEIHHSALGTRWVYDGLRDPAYVVSLAATTMTGQGEAIGLAEFDGRWYLAPAKVRISGGGWGLERVPVDGWEITADDGPTVTLRNDRFALIVHRTPHEGERPPIGLVATWDGQRDPVVLAEVRP